MDKEQQHLISMIEEYNIPDVIIKLHSKEVEILQRYYNDLEDEIVLKIEELQLKNNEGENLEKIKKLETQKLIAINRSYILSKYGH